MARGKIGSIMTKTLGKKLIKGIFRVATWPLYILLSLLSRTGNADRAFSTFSQLLSLIPGKTGIYIRGAFYSQACPDTSDEIVVGFLTLLSHRDTTIKRGVYIGPQCNIGTCTIGENTLLGSGVHILSGKKQHNFDDLAITIKQQGGVFTKIEIGSDCWIGNCSTIMAAVGSHSIIAAASVVTKDVEKQVIAAGHPARVIKKRD